MMNMKTINVATVFSGIGSPEQALLRLGIPHNIVFACDNGEREIDIDYEREMSVVRSFSTPEQKCEYVNGLYSKSRQTNFVQKSYMSNYNIDVNKFYQDILLLDGTDYVGKVDLFDGGSPCQRFSIAGARGGFEDTRGTLFFDVAEILRRYQPKAFFLENVKGLVIHDKGRTFKTILNTLDEVGYVVPDAEIVNAMYFGVPQHRERIFIVGFRKDLGISKADFKYPEQKEVTKKWIDVREENAVPAKYYLSTQYIQTLINHKARHEAKGNGFGYDIIPDDGIAHAIVVGGMGRESNLVIDFRQTDLTPTTRIKGEVNRQGWRKMTPREWARLQGYPDTFDIVVADASAYKQFGNSVAVPAIQATAEQILKTLKHYGHIR